MRVISVSTLKEFWARLGRGDAEQPLRTWVKVVKAADWSRPTDVKNMFRSADILPNGKAIFDVGENKYRPVVAIHYRGKRIYVRFVGTHEVLSRKRAYAPDGAGSQLSA